MNHDISVTVATVAVGWNVADRHVLLFRQAVEWTNKSNMELNSVKAKGMSIYFGHKALKIVPIKMNGN